MVGRSSLSGNRLAGLGAGHLSGLRAIKFLYLAANELTEIERGAIPASLQFMYVYKEQVRRATWRQPCYFVCARASRCGRK
jgi:hypothetical protein